MTKARRRRTRFEASGDPITVRALSSAVDRLSAMVEKLLNRGQEPAPAETVLKPIVALTARERDVARLIVEGLSSKQIAQSLTLELSTVHAHRRSISRKIGTSSQAGLAAYQAQWDPP